MGFQRLDAELLEDELVAGGLGGRPWGVRFSWPFRRLHSFDLLLDDIGQNSQINFSHKGITPGQRMLHMWFCPPGVSEK